MILSILICSVTSRAALLKVLLVHLNKQIINPQEVEILTAIDQGKMSTGKKRNYLVDRAHGHYIIFIDDDDWVPNYYISKLLAACRKDCDCVAINGTITTNGKDEITWRISKRYSNTTIRELGRPIYLRKTNHITAVRREIALRAPFPDKSNGEDKAYSDTVNKFLKTETLISEPMYHYRYSTKNKLYKQNH